MSRRFAALILASGLAVLPSCANSDTQQFLHDTLVDSVDAPVDGTVDGIPDGLPDSSVDPDAVIEVLPDGGCPPPLTACAGLCMDLQADVMNCGTCGNACAPALNADAACEAGVCATSCVAGWTDPDVDGDCDYPCAYTGAEACNGVDDDCNGLVDETFACALGSMAPCTTTCGSAGLGLCSLSCMPAVPASCNIPAETCNGADDDCDLEIDEDFECAAGRMVDCISSCGGVGQGRCRDDCTPPLESDCGIGVEVCNGLDDNCNGTSDEGYLCVAGASVSCTTSCGSSGTGACSATCTPPSGSACAPPSETCNGIDDDCSGARDDGFGMQCVAGASGQPCTTLCGTTGFGTCSASCTMPAPASCSPPSETCNGLDDNCSGTADDGPGMTCVLGSGGLACTTGGGTAGTQSCTGSCTRGPCCASTDTCGNSFDDDCDGTVDDGCCSTIDACACAGTIGFPGSVSGSSSGMLDDYWGGCGSTGGFDVVYQLVVPSSGTVHLDTNGSVFDTLLYVYSGSCGGTVVACDDDSGDGVQSLLDLTLSAGTYWVVVDGFSSGSYGSYVLNASGSGSSGSGENCSGPIVRAWPGSVTGASTTTFIDDWSSWSCQSSSSGPDVVYRLTLSADATVTIDTIGSGFDTVLAVLDASCTSTLACNDDYSGLQSWVSLYLSAGTYAIVVDGYGGSSGTYNLNVSY